MTDAQSKRRHAQRNANQKTSFLNQLYLHGLLAPILPGAFVDGACSVMFSCSTIAPFHRANHCPNPWFEGWLNASQILLHLQERCRVATCPQAVHLPACREEVEDSILQGLGVDHVSFCIARHPYQIQIVPTVQSRKRLEVPFQSIAAPMHRFYPKRHPYAQSFQQFDRLKRPGDSTAS